MHFKGANFDAGMENYGEVAVTIMTYGEEETSSVDTVASATWLVKKWEIPLIGYYQNHQECSRISPWLSRKVPGRQDHWSSISKSIFQDVNLRGDPGEGIKGGLGSFE